MKARSQGNRDRFFSTKRTALFLYSILVVLPALVFGGLHWRSLYRDHGRQLEEAPGQARDAGVRVRGEFQSRVEALLDAEEARDFREYQLDHLSEGTTGELAFAPSELLEHPELDKIEAWFTYDMWEETPQVSMFDGRHSDWLAERERLQLFVENVLVKDRRLRPELRPGKPGPPPEQDPTAAVDRATPQTLPLGVVAVNLSPIRDREMLEAKLAELGELQDRPIEIPRTGFRLRLTREEEGRLRVYATRQVLVRAQLGDFPEDFEDLARDKVLVQGFFLKPEWLLQVLPSQVCYDVLPSEQAYLFWNHAPEELKSTDLVHEVQLFDAIDLEVDREGDMRLGIMKFVVSLGEMKERFFYQWLGFGSVAAVMAVSLAIGMGLLVRSVKASLEQARRTENFVASVTHELRTPIAAVKMYGEMLRDGWVSSEDKQNEYFQRIVRESDRLATLIDRVLLKRKLGVEPAAPEPGDLNAVLRSQIAELEGAGPDAGDLRFELADDLPPVLLAPEGVHSVLVNLVENARKYAPVRNPVRNPLPTNGTPGDEPILVRTYLSKGKVVLEVSDRGPGIPEAERSKIFDAFYRIGDERTRTTPGTGLGLHLVFIQARGMKARIQVLAREGGGATFRVTFKTLARQPQPA